MRAGGLATDIRIVRGGLTEADGQRGGDELLFGPETVPTAIFAFNDHCAAGLQATARVHRLDLPQELSIVGYDDSRIAQLSTVDLTTIGQDTHTLAGHAVSRATAWADGTAEHACESWSHRTWCGVRAARRWRRSPPAEWAALQWA